MHALLWHTARLPAWRTIFRMTGTDPDESTNRDDARLRQHRRRWRVYDAHGLRFAIADIILPLCSGDLGRAERDADEIALHLPALPLDTWLGIGDEVEVAPDEVLSIRGQMLTGLVTRELHDQVRQLPQLATVGDLAAFGLYRKVVARIANPLLAELGFDLSETPVTFLFGGTPIPERPAPMSAESAVLLRNVLATEKYRDDILVDIHVRIARLNYDADASAETVGRTVAAILDFVHTHTGEYLANRSFPTAVDTLNHANRTKLHDWILDGGPIHDQDTIEATLRGWRSGDIDATVRGFCELADHWRFHLLGSPAPADEQEFWWHILDLAVPEDDD